MVITVVLASLREQIKPATSSAEDFS